jgi:hypothetical protein
MSFAMLNQHYLHLKTTAEQTAKENTESPQREQGRLTSPLLALRALDVSLTVLVSNSRSAIRCP